MVDKIYRTKCITENKEPMFKENPYKMKTKGSWLLEGSEVYIK